MSYFIAILPVISLLVGWGLSHASKYFSDKKQDKRKLKKLLFNLLELRWLLHRELKLEENFDKLLQQLALRFNKEFDVEISKQEFDFIKPAILKILSSDLNQPEKIQEIEIKIDSVVDDLSEIYPVFAYKLTGKYKVKERIESFESYWVQVEKTFKGVPFSLSEYFGPRSTKELLDELDSFILDLSKKCGNGINKETIGILNVDYSDPIPEMDKYIDMVIKMLRNNELNEELSVIEEK